nr:phosphatidylglycerophosphatase A [Acinetobacter larvae]
MAPKAPGTFGSLFALLFVPIFMALGYYPALLLILIMTVLGIYICGKSAELMGVHDDGRIVWDEFAGQSITFLPLIYINQMSWAWLLIGFSLFRLFDIWKPWPIGVVDRQVAGGLGIMLDDVIAGIWAALCIVLYLYISIS